MDFKKIQSSNSLTNNTLAFIQLYNILYNLIKEFIVLFNNIVFTFTFL